MSPTPQIGMDIEPLLFRGKFLLAHGVQKWHRIVVGRGYWNHSLGCWVKRSEEATLFDTQAGAIVYRRGNMERMHLAIDSDTSCDECCPPNA